jgi:AcrR family transcriptional regulator
MAGQERDTRRAIAETLIRLTESQPYRSITVAQICQAVPVSRNTFYYHFDGKDALAQWIVSQHYLTYCYPVFSVCDKEAAAQAFFTYVERFKPFYTALYHADGGALLTRCLYQAYGYALEPENVTDYSTPSHSAKSDVDPDICRRYTNSGTAAVVAAWVGDGMRESCQHMGRNLRILLTTSLEDVRDHHMY